MTPKLPKRLSCTNPFSKNALPLGVFECFVTSDYSAHHIKHFFRTEQFLRKAKLGSREGFFTFLAKKAFLKEKANFFHKSNNI